MNKNIISRIFTSLFTCAMTVAMLIPAFAVNAETKIKISEKNFPDKNFRKALKDNYDEGDGYLSSGIWELEVEKCGIKDLKGIELLPNLGKLWCRGNEITSLDLSMNTNLCDLNINYNKIVKLDLSKNTELDYLRCDGNLLETLDLSKNTRLRVLDIENNKIDKIDLSKNTDLEYLYCGGNLFETLDLSKNTDLVRLDIDNNKLNTLDLSKNKRLEDLYIKNSNFETLDLSKNTNLVRLEIDNNKFKTLDLSKNTMLKYLKCGGNLFETLDLSKNTKLKTLYIEKNKLTNLDLSKNKNIEILDLSDNNLEKLDLSKNSKIDNLFVSNNCLIDLDLSSLPELLHIECSNNAITFLDVNSCPLIRYIDCDNNKLTSIDISANPELYHLCCQGNQIDKLDISGCECLIKAYKGDKAKKKGYVVYTYKDDYKLAVDNKTIVKVNAQTIVDDKTKHMFLNQGAVVFLGFEGADDQTQVTLTSSNHSIVKTGSDNTLVAGKAGSSDITAIVGDKTYKFKVTVYFKDVKDNSKFWFEPTYALTEKGVIKGYGNQTSFRPQYKCTRAQMVTFFWRLMGSPKPKGKDCSFSDVNKGDYFYKACIWANEKNIVEGYEDGTFGPQNVCTRKEAVTFLWRLAGKPEPKTSKCKFTDVDPDEYYYKAVLWASEKKIVAGYSDNTFRPDGDCLRRQIVTFLYKYDKYVGVK